MPNRIVNTPRSLSPSRGDSASAASFVSRKRSLVDSRQRTNCASERTPPEPSGTREPRPRERVSVPAHWGAAPDNPAGTRLSTGIMVTYHGTAHVRLPCALRPRGLANRNGEARIAGLCAVGRGFSPHPPSRLNPAAAVGFLDGIPVVGTRAARRVVVHTDSCSHPKSADAGVQACYSAGVRAAQCRWRVALVAHGVPSACAAGCTTLRRSASVRARSFRCRFGTWLCVAWRALM